MKPMRLLVFSLSVFMAGVAPSAQAQPTLVSLLPASKTAVLGGQFELTVTIAPVQIVDTIVTLSSTGAVLHSPEVTVPTGMTTALFTVVTGFAPGQATITASLNGSQASTLVTILAAAQAPDAPVIGAATPGNTQASIAFTPPASDGGAAITGYTATCQPGGFTGNASASPAVVAGLGNGVNYSCSVTASNSAGTSVASGSVPVTPEGSGVGVRGDFNGDGRADILWRNAASGQNYLYPMDGLTILGTEGFLRTVANQDWKIAGVGDFDGDGLADILWRNGSSGENYIYLMEGTTIKPSEGYLRTVADQDWQVAGIGDLNGDGKDDIVWRNTATGENYFYPMSGLVILGSEGYLRTVADQNWRIAGVGDFDGDGRSDLVWRNFATGENYVYQMNGTAISGEGYVRTVADLNWRVAGVGDFNADGRDDILWRNAQTGENYLYPMNGLAILATEGYLRIVADLNWEVKGTGDYDGDGKADVLWRNAATGENYVYFMDGTTIKPTEGYLRTVADPDWRVFAPEPPVAAPLLVRFVAMGATGEGNAGQLQVAAAIQAKCAASGCDFVQLLGNNFYDSGVDSTSDSQWNSKFEVPYADIDLPFYAVLGNHDYGNAGAGSDAAKAQHQVDYTAVSPGGKWRMPAKHYHRSVNHVEFFALDSTMQMFGTDAAQRTAVAGWLAASTATWKIAFGLHSYRSNGQHGNAGTYEGIPGIPIVSGAGVKSFMDQIVCGNVDLHLSAFDHSLQWLQSTCAGTELIVSGAGSKLSALPRTNPVHFQSSQLGFVYVVIDGNTLTAEFIDTAGTVLFTRSIVKP